MPGDGYNPMRWDCTKRGCFNEKRRPKLEQFAECFPRRIGMSDVDGIVEINGRFLLLEWKGPGASVPTGQDIMFRRLTKDAGFFVLVVEGDAETMGVVSVTVYWQGTRKDALPADMDHLRGMMRRWASWAQEAADHAAR